MATGTCHWQCQWAECARTAVPVTVGRVRSHKRAKSNVKSGLLGRPAAPREILNPVGTYQPGRDTLAPPRACRRLYIHADKYDAATMATNAPTMRTPEPTLDPMLLECAASAEAGAASGTAASEHYLTHATYSRAPGVSHSDCAHRPSNLSLDLRPSGASRHQSDRVPCCCVHRGASAAAVTAVATASRPRSRSPLLKQMPCHSSNPKRNGELRAGP